MKTTECAARPLPVNKRLQIDRQILKMVVKEYPSFNIVENDKLKKLISMLNPNYEPPSRKTFHSKKYICRHYKKEEVRKEMTNASFIL